MKYKLKEGILQVKPVKVTEKTEGGILLSNETMHVTCPVRFFKVVDTHENDKEMRGKLISLFASRVFEQNTAKKKFSFAEKDAIVGEALPEEGEVVEDLILR